MILLFVIAAVWGKGMSSIGLTPHDLLAGIRKGLLWSAGFGMCTLLVFAVLHVAGVNPLERIKTSLPPGTRETVLFFVVGGLIAPVTEEIFFRGYLYGFLRRWGVLAAVVGSTLLFVAAHAIGSVLPLTQLVGGILFALAYEATGNLMVPITIHVLGNNAIFILSLAV
jgi:hypothetical protein